MPALLHKELDLLRPGEYAPVWSGQYMKALCIFVGMAVFGCVGSWLGNMIGFTTGLVVGGIGSMAGVYVGWRVNRDYFG